MKLAKSLLLGSAAGIVAVAGASAADLGVKKPSAVEYVKTCPTYGAGFFVIPGTQNCLKLIGRVRVDYAFGPDTTRTARKNLFRARGYLGFDHRTATEYGLLRTYVRAYIARDNAAGGHGSAAGSAYAPVLEYAYIQFGGLTVGRVASVYEHGYNPSITIPTDGLGFYSDMAYVNSIGYTHAFGGGFSATVALDAAAERQVGVAGLGGAVTPGPGADGLFGTPDDVVGPARTAQGLGGQAMPDIVGRLAYDASWGSVSLAGAIHQVRVGHYFNRPAASTRYGYAGQLAVKVNLPMLSAGSNVWASLNYAEGASRYTGYNSGAQSVGGATFTPSDATIVGAGPGAAGSLRLTKTWGISGGIQAYVTSQVWLAVFGGYSVHDAFGPNNTVRTIATGAQVGWTPVAGFNIISEVGYQKLTGRLAAAGGAITLVDSNKRDAWVGRLRFQRDF